MDELPERLARMRRERHRQELRRKQVRRRRFILTAAAAAVVLVGVFILTRGEDTPGVQKKEAVAKVREVKPDAGWKKSKAPVPILMYHVIGEPAGEVTYPDLYLSTDDFQQQVDWLDDNNYTAVTLIQVQEAWYDDGTLPEKPIVLSFDDGYLGQYLDAMPILRKHGWAGQLNLKSEGSDLNSTQVKKMIKAGWEIASHTVTHPDLTTLDGAALESELVDSKESLEKDLGIEIVNFCYPAGQYDDEAVAAVEAAGYRGATTVDPGLAKRSEPFTLKRIRIDRGFGPSQLEAALGSASG